MKTEVRMVSPDGARQMLKRNGNNRAVSKKHINFLSNEMKKGNWLFDGAPIRFSEGGVLLDGQHRLNAVIDSDTTQQFLIVTGIEHEAFKVMDTGKNRNAGDIMSIEGIKYPNQTAATIRIIIKMKNGVTSNGGGNKPSNTEVLDFYNNTPQIIRFVSEAQKLYLEFDRIVSLSTIAAFKYLMAERSIIHSEDFWNKLCTGISLDSTPSIKHLRSKLIRDKIARAKLSATEKNAIIILSWNAFRRDAPIKTLVHWRKDSKFPTFI